MYHYDTIMEALQDLKKRGYLYDFNLKSHWLYCEALKRRYSAPQLQVREVYRFEGNTDPADEAVVYALAATDGVQGTLVNAYGTYADTDSETILQQLSQG